LDDEFSDPGLVVTAIRKPLAIEIKCQRGNFVLPAILAIRVSPGATDIPFLSGTRFELEEKKLPDRFKLLKKLLASPFFSEFGEDSDEGPQEFFAAYLSP